MQTPHQITQLNHLSLTHTDTALASPLDYAGRILGPDPIHLRLLVLVRYGKW